MWSCIAALDSNTYSRLAAKPLKMLPFAVIDGDEIERVSIANVTGAFRPIANNAKKMTISDHINSDAATLAPEPRALPLERHLVAVTRRFRPGDYYDLPEAHVKFKRSGLCLVIVDFSSDTLETEHVHAIAADRYYGRSKAEGEL